MLAQKRTLRLRLVNDLYMEIFTLLPVQLHDVDVLGVVPLVV